MDTAIANRPEGRALATLEINDILKYLPHRYPFLMVDRIIEIDGDETAIGIKNVTYNEPLFQGHFPGKPVFPGVLIIEAIAQTAGAIVMANEAERGTGKKLVLMLTIDRAKFRKPAGPGDRIEFHIRKIHRRRTVGRYEGRAMVDGVLIAEAEVGAMIVPEE
ncbi:MAG TPA: 3-hydroxyacyl-ACP dehydratase FabZ [Alphaproteobacteria bacterium]|nr:3-hydroxyacyl-ACP dehydratase FabZ [Alphaproteobacteria bacterium]